MTNEEFINYAAQNIKRYLPAGFEEAEVITDECVRPNDERFHSLLLLAPGRTTGPKIPLEDYAELVRSGHSLDSVMLSMAEVFTTFKPPSMPERLELTDFDSVKGYLTTKLCDPENSRHYLSDKPWTPVGDWGLLYRLQLASQGNMVGSAPVTNTILDFWGLDTETLHREAVANESAKDPAWMVDLLGAAFFGRPNGGVNLLDAPSPLNPGLNDAYVLSNRSHFNGACVVGWDGVLDRIGEVIGHNFYVVPSSIHEVMIVPDLPGRSARSLESTLRDANADPSVVQTEDVLSNRLQYYDRSERRLGAARNRA